jgi:hypothetical protein
MFFLHHRPINVPTAGAQAFLMNYTQGERVITTYLTTTNAGGTDGLTCLPKHNVQANTNECRINVSDQAKEKQIIIGIQSTAHQTVQFGFCTAFISKA